MSVLFTIRQNCPYKCVNHSNYFIGRYGLNRKNIGTRTKFSQLMVLRQNLTKIIKEFSRKFTTRENDDCRKNVGTVAVVECLLSCLI